MVSEEKRWPTMKRKRRNKKKKKREGRGSHYVESKTTLSLEAVQQVSVLSTYSSENRDN